MTTCQQFVAEVSKVDLTFVIEKKFSVDSLLGGFLSCIKFVWLKWQTSHAASQVLIDIRLRAEKNISDLCQSLNILCAKEVRKAKIVHLRLYSFAFNDTT